MDNKIILTKETIKSYCIILLNKQPSAVYASKELKKYLNKIFGSKIKIVKEKKDNSKVFEVCCDLSLGLEEYIIDKRENGDIAITGGRRGVLYGVYSFLEELGCRFFTRYLEKIPTQPISIEIGKSQVKPQFMFRDSLFYHTMGLDGKPLESADKFAAKLKNNSELWHCHEYGKKRGYGVHFAGCPAHTLTGQFLVPEKKYAKTHPEYYALVDGKRITDLRGQICYTNEELPEVVYKEAVEWLKKDPVAEFISLSVGEGSYCQCENCKKAYETIGIERLQFDFINKVAKMLKKDYPNVYVHILAYGLLTNPPKDIEFEDNIMVQYCDCNMCVAHRLDDETCVANKKVYAEIKRWSELCKNIIAWTYPNNFSHELLLQPEIPHLRNKMECFANLNVKGLLAEGSHHLNHNFAAFDDLKSYLYLKLMWNPYMSEEEYQGHMEDFMHAFYGENYMALKEYIYFHSEFLANLPIHINMSFYDTSDLSAHLVPDISIKDIKEFAKKSYALFDKALEGANKEQKERILKDRTSLEFMESYYTMHKIMENGTEEEKQEAIEKNRKLIADIKKYNLKITFWGVTVKTQMKFLSGADEIPPKQWRYEP